MQAIYKTAINKSSLSGEDSNHGNPSGQLFTPVSQRKLI